MEYGAVPASRPPCELLQEPQAGRMFLRAYVPPTAPGTIRSTVMVASVSGVWQ